VKVDSLQELYLEQLQGLYDAEHQIIKALPKMIDAAKSNELRSAPALSSQIPSRNRLSGSPVFATSPSPCFRCSSLLPLTVFTMSRPESSQFILPTKTMPFRVR